MMIFYCGASFMFCSRDNAISMLSSYFILHTNESLRLVSELNYAEDQELPRENIILSEIKAELESEVKSLNSQLS